MKMNRIDTDPSYFQLMKLYDNFIRSQGITLQDPSEDTFLKAFNEILLKHKQRANLIHGFRVQALFAHMAAALGKCVFITEEDSGEFFSKYEDQKRPDFRIVTDDGNQFLVEVKNFHETNLDKPFVMKKNYLDNLMNYSKYFRCELKIAIYWSKWKLWSLISPLNFDINESIYSINFFKALKQSEMHLLGDCWIGTVPPLSIRFETETLSRSLSNHYEFKIKKVSLFAAGNCIEDEVEKNVASFLMFFGDWQNIDKPAQVEDGKLVSFELQLYPIEEVKNQGFQIIGQLSQMISRQYDLLTTENGIIKTINPVQFDGMGVAIPNDYNGHALKLWRFYMQI